jgi:hypothetical protein
LLLKRVAKGEPLREIALSYAADQSTISGLKARTQPRSDDYRDLESWA